MRCWMNQGQEYHIPDELVCGDGFIAERPFVRLPVSQDALAQAAYAAGVWAAGRVDGETEFSLDMKAVEKSILANMIPDSTILSPLVDVSTNTSWTGSPIVPARLEDEYTTPELRIDTDIHCARVRLRPCLAKTSCSPAGVAVLAEQYGLPGPNGNTHLLAGYLLGEWSGELALRNVMASWRNSPTITRPTPTSDRFTTTTGTAQPGTGGRQRRAFCRHAQPGLPVGSRKPTMKRRKCLPATG